ncbi:Rv1157c family protein [Gordonia paraffinivorans]|uniref:Rv1157c family protein n=1 Tax=Gordonia paraffinivorans TaxID=175628 RepID=UPI003FCC56B9
MRFTRPSRLRSTASRPHRTRRMLVSASAIVAAAGLAFPAVAQAEPAPKVDQRVLDSLGAFAPAIIGSVATPGPDGKVDAQLLNQAEKFANTPGMPAEVSKIWRSVADFLGEPGRRQAAKQLAAEQKKGDPEIPTGPNAPKIQEFLYPTFGLGCIPGGGSLGRALVTAGPQDAPWPGPQRGEGGYVYTALGTGPAVDNKAQPLVVSWLNVDTGRSGELTLKKNERINAQDGPGTFTGIARTGKGRVISAIHGNVTTKTKGKVVSCTIVPVIGLAII